MWPAMNSSTSAGTGAGEYSAALRRRIASRVSRSGGRMSARRPLPWNRDRSRSSIHQVLGRAVAGENHLVIQLVEGVERVEDFFEHLLLAFEELDVVEQQHVDGPVAMLEGVHPLGPDAVHELVEEVLGGHVPDGGGRPVLQDVMTDGVEQVGLAETGPAVYEERVVVVAPDPRRPVWPRPGRAGWTGRPRRCRKRTCSGTAANEPGQRRWCRHLPSRTRARVTRRAA